MRPRSTKVDKEGKHVLKTAASILDRRTGKPFSVDLKREGTEYTFMQPEDQTEFTNAVSAHRASGGLSLQLRSFIDGVWDLIRRQDTFVAYKQLELEKFVGGVSEIDP